jgi:UDP-N-acetyl-D-mannosaminuronate dehydrogenase
VRRSYGLGYVGLSLALTVSEKLYTVGFDVNGVHKYSRFCDYAGDIPAKRNKSTILCIIRDEKTMAENSLNRAIDLLDINVKITMESLV